MTRPIILDTCAVVWIAEDEPIAAAAREALEAALRERAEILVSPMTAWEIGLLAASGRLTLTMAPERWFARFVATPGVAEAPLTAEILVASATLPGRPPADPADRIVAATARHLAGRLMTRDPSLLAYAAAGHLDAIAC